MSLDMTAFDAALKSHYTADRVEDMTYQSNPLFALMPKMENFGGRNLPIPIVYGNPQGRSKTFSNAQTRGGETTTLVTDFVLTRVKDYAIATIDNETLEASKGDANAFMDAATTEIDGSINALTRSLAINQYRTSAVAYGQVLAEPDTHATLFVITLKNIADITNFEVGQVVKMYAALSGGSPLTSDGTDDEWAIANVDRDAGTISLVGEYDASGDIAADAYIFIEGDRGLGLSGLEDWVPASAPDSTSYFGVDRSVDVTRLGGLRLSGTSAPIEEVLIEADAKVGREGFQLDHFFSTYSKFGELKKSLGTKVQYVDLAANARVSFRGVMVDGNKGPIKVVPDQNCPGNRIFGLTLKYWKFYSLGKAVRVIDTDGLQMLRQGSADGVEARHGSYSQVGCRAPGANINIQV